VLALHDGEIVSEDRTEITGADKGKLFPSDMAGVVTDFLVKYFKEVIDYNFTAKVEAEFDEIAAGRLAWQDMIAGFYGPFHEDVERAEKIDRDEANPPRQLGIDPKSGRPVSVRIGRYGPYVQIGTRDDDEKPLFAGLRPGQHFDKVTLEEVLPLFDLPRFLGETPDGEEVMVNIGRFGPYASYFDKDVAAYLEQHAVKGIELVPQNVSIEPEDPHTITMEGVLPFIEAKKEADANKEILLFEGSPIQVLDGRWGPFITDGFKNARIPGDKDPGTLTLQECRQLLDETKKVRKRLSRQFYGGGFRLIRDCGGRPDAIIKTDEKSESRALEIADALTAEGKKIRLISARGAAAIRAAESRKSRVVKKKAVKKKAAKKKKATKKKAVRKKVSRKKTASGQ